MPLISYLHYEPQCDKINSEDDLVILLKDVGGEIDSLSRLKNSKLSYVWGLIESGIFDDDIIIGRGHARYVVDLSNAKKLIADYRGKSEGGCQSCVEKAEVHKNLEIYPYCRLTENERDIDDKKGCSPKIEKYSEKGCDNRISFFKPIEEVLRKAREL